MFENPQKRSAKERLQKEFENPLVAVRQRAAPRGEFENPQQAVR